MPVVRTVVSFVAFLVICLAPYLNAQDLQVIKDSETAQYVGKGQEAYVAMKRMMEKLGLTVNEDKTRLCRVPEETFEFLGYSFWAVLFDQDRETARSTNLTLVSQSLHE